MDIGRRWWGICLMLAMATLGCSTKGDLVVLLPDDNGTVGRVAVTTRGGSQVLVQANQAVEVRGPDAPPTPPAVMQPQEIEKLFGPAMAAMPAAALHFILYFESGAADLSPNSKALLPDILEAIRTRTPADVVVIGHTDRTGSEEYNRRLSLLRADRVRKILAQGGADPSTIEVAYHGEGAPLIATEDDVPEPRNRRVEVVVR